MKQKGLYFSSDVFLYPVFLVLALWVVFWMDVRLGFNGSVFGIFPLKVEGLIGILTGPFIHGSLEHLFNNSVPLLVLVSALFYFYRNHRWKVLFYGVLLTGLLTWLIGRPAWHIGASGIVYMLVAFLFFKGILSRQYQLVAVSLIVVFLYGSLLWYLFPIDEKISWEGHTSGFVVGFVFSFFFRSNIVERKKYEWERPDYNPDEDLFLQHFDDDGNFIEQVAETDIPVVNSATETPVRIRYILKRKSDLEEPSN
ncbi:MAG: rhomboid family intramembrane serine protease [Flavobacteriaceae bacterium]|nr:rhomboid family intramembrane serine protease [Flavobacteriaceae bacterium]